jgi:hypothetical protein
MRRDRLALLRFAVSYRSADNAGSMVKVFSAWFF